MLWNQKTLEVQSCWVMNQIKAVGSYQPLAVEMKHRDSH
jgi:hypothetical protein